MAEIGLESMADNSFVKNVLNDSKKYAEENWVVEAPAPRSVAVPRVGSPLQVQPTHNLTPDTLSMINQIVDEIYPENLHDPIWETVAPETITMGTDTTYFYGGALDAPANMTIVPAEAQGAGSPEALTSDMVHDAMQQLAFLPTGIQPMYVVHPQTAYTFNLVNQEGLNVYSGGVNIGDTVTVGTTTIITGTNSSQLIGDAFQSTFGGSTTLFGIGSIFGGSTNTPIGGVPWSYPVQYPPEYGYVPAGSHTFQLPYFLTDQDLKALAEHLGPALLQKLMDVGLSPEIILEAPTDWEGDDDDHYYDVRD